MKGKLAISVSKDTMIATASIIPDNDIEVTESYILGELDKFGIKAGIDKAVVKKWLRMKNTMIHIRSLLEKMPYRERMVFMSFSLIQI